MAIAPSLFDLFNSDLFLTPAQHYQPEHLRSLFRDRISRSKATGKDGTRVGIFENRLEEELAIIERKIADQTYRFTTFKERLILKGAGKVPRQISIPTVRDRLVLRAMCQVLHSTVPRSTGFAPHALIDEVAKRLRATPQERSFIRIDVRDFFPSINHLLLQQELARFHLDPTTESLCMKAVTTNVGSSPEPPMLGIPQGLSISGALAGIYMLRFDDRQVRRHVDYFRYVDDILVIADTERASSTLASFKRALKRLKLDIHPINTAGKTEISSTEGGIDYLGYNISRELISIRLSSFRRMFKNVLKVITDYRYRQNVERLIFRLNLKVSGCLVDGKRRGWMMFFSRTENKRQLAHLDAFVRQQLSRVDLPQEQRGRVKTFMKSYHEICYNLAETRYIPNFDLYDLDEKIEVISILTGRTLEEISTQDIESIEREFSRLIGQEILDLERDVGNPS